MKQKLAKTNQSVEKVLQIIEVMINCKEPMRLQDISEQTELPTSTASRLLNTLAIYNYVNQDPKTLRYYLSLKFAYIGSKVSSQSNIRDIAHPYLAELSETCQEATSLAIEGDMEVVYIDICDRTDSILKITQRIGKRAPLHTTGVGKGILLNYSKEEIKELISKKGLIKFTPNTITTLEQLLAELDKLRVNNYCLDDEECELGVRCIAAPIRDYTGKVVAGISVTGPVGRMSMNRIEEIKPIILDTAKKISQKLGHY